jgi:hypothetical protein|tara:strand:+ start:21599 stop:22954 length:1356 start_codon:yes stop_codon:yes gene_type:complete
MDFLKYLKNYENENVDKTRKLVKESNKKINTVIKEAYYGEFVSKEEAKLRISDEFVDKKRAPKSIDTKYVKENLTEIIDKLESLDEGSIKIIINNDVDKGKGSPAPIPAPSIPLPIPAPITKGEIVPDIEFEESLKGKKKKKSYYPEKDEDEKEGDEELLDEMKDVEHDGKNYKAMSFKTEKEAKDYVKKNKDYSVLKTDDDGTVYVSKKDDKGTKVEIDEDDKKGLKENYNIIEDLEELEKDEDFEDDETEEASLDIKWSDLEKHLGNIDDKLQQLVDAKDEEEGEEVEDELSDELLDSDDDELLDDDVNLAEEGDDNGVVYGNVIFLQGKEATEPLNIIKRDADKGIKYLSQWDAGEYNDIIKDYRDEIGTHDETHEGENYVLAYNPKLGHVSLYAKLPKDEYEMEESKEEYTEECDEMDKKKDKHKEELDESDTIKESKNYLQYLIGD